jgi:hypothetical protein
MTFHPYASYTNGMKSEKNNDRSMMKESKSYQIALMGEVDQSRIDWFLKMGFDVSLSSTTQGSITVLTGQVHDQSYLRGFLNQLWDLNFEVILVTRLETFIGEHTNE